MKPTLALRSFLLGSSILAASPLLHAADFYWNTTTTGTWATGGNWSDNATSGGTTGTVPGSGDTATFNQSSVNDAETVQLTGATAIGGITFNNTGLTSIRSNTTTTRVLTIGAGGITVASNAGANSEIGAASGAPVSVTLGASQEWTNNSNGNFFVRNGGSLGANTLTLTTTGAGGMIFPGTVSGSGNIIVSANSKAAMSGGASTYSGTTTINSGGILTVNAMANFGTAGGLGKKTSNLASNLVLDGGTLKVQVSSTTSDRLFTVGAGGATFEAALTGAVSGQIQFTGSTAITYSGVGDRSITLSGTSDDAGGSSIARVIGDVGGGNGIVSLVKNGTHAWTVSGANTYTGNTIVDDGTLTFASSAESLFVIGALGVNNAILGDASNAIVNLNGLFSFDLASASTIDNDFWNIVDVGNLTETYGSTFSVESTTGGVFSETGLDSGIWTKDENGVTYQFTQSDGVLTVIPEPSAALLGALGVLALLRRRSRA